MKINEMWLVLVPNEKSEMVDIVVKVTVVELAQMFLGGLKTESIMATFTEEHEAVKMGAEALAMKRYFKEVH